MFSLFSPFYNESRSAHFSLKDSSLTIIADDCLRVKAIYISYSVSNSIKGFYRDSIGRVSYVSISGPVPVYLNVVVFI